MFSFNNRLYIIPLRDNDSIIVVIAIEFRRSGITTAIESIELWNLIGCQTTSRSVDWRNQKLKNTLGSFKIFIRARGWTLWAGLIGDWFRQTIHSLCMMNDYLLTQIIPKDSIIVVNHAKHVISTIWQFFEVFFLFMVAYHSHTSHLLSCCPNTSHTLQNMSQSPTYTPQSLHLLT